MKNLSVIVASLSILSFWSSQGMDLSKNAAANQETEVRAFDLQTEINTFAQEIISSEHRNFTPGILMWLKTFSEDPSQVWKGAFLSVKPSSMFLTQLYNLLTDAIEWAYIRKFDLLEQKLEILRCENDKTITSGKLSWEKEVYGRIFREKQLSLSNDEALAFNKNVIREACERLMTALSTPTTSTHASCPASEQDLRDRARHQALVGCMYESAGLVPAYDPARDENESIPSSGIPAPMAASAASVAVASNSSMGSAPLSASAAAAAAAFTTANTSTTLVSHVASTSSTTSAASAASSQASTIERICSICDEEWTLETLALIKGGNCKCVAKYHKACLDKWFQTSKTCPTCRAADVSIIDMNS